MVSDDVVSAVAKTVDLAEDDVRRVLAAVESVLEGDPVGTVVQDPETGAVAVRVVENGVPAWKVTTTCGDQWRDVQPRLDGWKPLSV